MDTASCSWQYIFKLYANICFDTKSNKRKVSEMSVTKVGKNKYRIFISDGSNLDGSRRRFSKTVTTDLKGRDLKSFLTLQELEFEKEVKKQDPKFAKLARGTF